MPRKVTGEKLEKVVSTTISADEFKLLQESARNYYNRNLIVQPTTAHLLRFILKSWAKSRKKEMDRIATTEIQGDLNKAGRDPTP
jgi:hypothetical protein